MPATIFREWAPYALRPHPDPTSTHFSQLTSVSSLVTCPQQNHKGLLIVYIQWFHRSVVFHIRGHIFLLRNSHSGFWDTSYSLLPSFILSRPSFSDSLTHQALISTLSFQRSSIYQTTIQNIGSIFKMLNTGENELWTG